METLIIRHGCPVDPDITDERPRTVFIRNGRIDRILTEQEESAHDLPHGDGARVVDAAGMMLLPGLADAHVHFRDPGFTEKEDMETGAAAAAHGGFTSAVMMGNTNPHPDTPERVAAMADRAGRTGIRLYCCGNITMGMAGRELTDFEALKDAGVVLLSDDGLPIRDAGLMEKACIRAASLGLILSLHEEDPAFIEQAGINRGSVAGSKGLAGADREAEISMVRRDTAIAERTGAELTIQHISAAESVCLIRDAKRRGVKIHAEATPHHFTLTEEAVIRFGTNAKMNPPLRTEADRLEIIKGLQDGTIDMIATDHAPHTQAEKAVEFTKAPSGIIGLETALSLVWRELVLPGYLTVPQAVERMTRAYSVYGLPGGKIREGAPADLVLFAPDEQWTVSDETLYSRARNTPFLGTSLPGVVRLTVCGGRIVFENRKEE